VAGVLGAKRVTKLNEIHAGHATEFLDTVLAGRKPKTKRNYLGILKTLLNRAVDWNVIAKNPIQDMKPPKVERKFHSYGKADVAGLIQEAKEPLRTAIILLVNTGFRRSELLNVRWDDVNLRKKELTVMPHDEFKTKSRSLRTVPLNNAALQALRRVKKKSKDEYVYWEYFQRAHTLIDHFARLAKRLGMRGNLHSLRHTFASHLANAGTPIPVLSELLGHSDIQTTMIYAYPSKERHHEVEKLDFE
jgi:integrase